MNSKDRVGFATRAPSSNFFKKMHFDLANQEGIATCNQVNVDFATLVFQLPVKTNKQDLESYH